jgi:hypothetical protein
MMDCLVGHAMLDLDAVLLPESDPLVLQHLRSLDRAGKIVDCKRRKTSEAWPAQHSIAFEKRGRDWTAPNPFRATDMMELFPGVRELSDRQADLLGLHGIGLPDVQRRIVDVSMSITFSSSKTYKSGASGCLSSGSLPWIGHRGRLALGVECFQLLGIFFDSAKSETLNSFGNSLLRDLSGSAFDSASFLSVWVCMMSLVSLCHQRRSTAAAKADAAK